MPIINESLAAVLDGLQRPGDFYTAGSLEIYSPRLEIDGIGPIALPLLPIQAEQLIGVAEPAPYGRGEQTLVDTDVRRTWQIAAEQIQIGGRHWDDTLSTIVTRATSGLGVEGPVRAELYKLLVYDEGSFFVQHRDTEKVAGMFATLVVVLPSDFSGGELVVRHQGRENRLELRTDDPADASFAAFYADCVHEVLPITAGCRLTLVYNLIRDARSEPPTAPDRRPEQNLLTELLRRWVADKTAELTDADADADADNLSAEKLIYPLEHAYSSAELAFDTLKNADAAVGATLAAAAEAADCELYLALVSIEESGSAENYGDGYRDRYDRWSEPDDDDFEIIEVYDRTAAITEWHCTDGKDPGLADLPFSEQELCPPGAFAKLEPDEQLFHEATGNEGASFERSYRQAVFVLWPRARRIAVLSQGGIAATLPWLAELAQIWIASGQTINSDQWQDASTLANHILNDWPDHDWARYQASEQGETAAYLTSLRRLRDQRHIDAFVLGLATHGPCHRNDCEALMQALEQLPVDRAIELLDAIVTHNAVDTTGATGACAHLLTVATAAVFLSGRSADLAPAASRLISALPADQKRAEPGNWRRDNPIDTDLVIDLLTATAAIDSDLADRALHHLVSNPDSFDPDALLVTAALRLTEQPGLAEQPKTPAPPVMEQLQHHVLTHLRGRIAEPLAPPEDWRRNHHVSCDCDYCHELSRFLAAPDQDSWKLKAAEAKRRHVEYSIEQDKCDLDCHTEKKGRPYTLVCSKNQASYLRRVEQRRQDLENLNRLSSASKT